jgi:hypothetical protein
MPADLIIRIPSTMPKDWTWFERLIDELLLRGIWGEIERKVRAVGWAGRVDEDLIYDALKWRCLDDGESKCPAIAFEGEKAYLLILDENEEKFVKVLELADVIAEEIGGVVRYSDCLAKYGYDYPC